MCYIIINRMAVGERTREPGVESEAGSRVRSPHQPIHDPKPCPTRTNTRYTGYRHDDDGE